MKMDFLSRARRYAVSFFKYLLFLFNLALLAGLGIKTVNLWISDPFDFADTLAAYPDEPEWIDKASAEKQFWVALTFETLIFVIGGFLCYELLIKRKTFRRGLIAPLVIAFLWATGESASLFLPATDKVQTIKACKSMEISWNSKTHRCRLMDLELKRFEKIKAAKKKPLKQTPPPAPPVEQKTLPAPALPAPQPTPAEQQPEKKQPEKKTTVAPVQPTSVKPTAKKQKKTAKSVAKKQTLARSAAKKKQPVPLKKTK